MTTIKSKFPFGTIKQIHKISGFEIIEYHVGSEWENFGAIEFSYNGVSYDTLDQALLGAICHRYAPDDSDLFYYAAKLIGIKPGE